MPLNNQHVRTVTASTTLEISDDVVRVDATAGAVTITLPSPLYQYNLYFRVIKVDSSLNAVTISVAGSGNTINGAASFVLTRQFQSVELTPDSGSNYVGTGTNSTGKSGATALTAAATVSINPVLNENFTLTPGEDETINAASLGVMGQIMCLYITTSGVTSRTLTFGTNFLSSGTLATGTTTAKKFLVVFRCDGAKWLEQSRTGAL